MACFEMSLPKSKRIRVIDADGREEFVQDDDFEELQAAQLAKQAELERESSRNDWAGQTSVSRRPAPMPLEALEKIQAAQGEIQVMLDLIDNVRGQEHVDFQACNASTHMESIAQEWAFKLASKTDELRDAAARLRRGASTLRQRVELDARFLNEVAHLQQAWPVSRAPTGTSGHFRVQLLRASLPQGPQRVGPEDALGQMPSDILADCFVDLLQDREGHVCVLQEHKPSPVNKAPDTPGRVIQGPQAVHAVLNEREAALCLRCLEHRLRAEAAASSNPSLTQLLPRILEQISTGNPKRAQSHAAASASSSATNSAPAGPPASSRIAPTLMPLGPALQQLAAACSPAGVLQHSLSPIGLPSGLGSVLQVAAPTLAAAAPAAAAVRGGGPTAAGAGLLEWAADWLRHSDTVSAVWADLRKQAEKLPGSRVELLPGISEQHPSTAFRIHLPPRDNVLLIISKQAMRLEGWQPQKRKEGPYWMGNTVHPISQPEIPSLLEVLHQSLQP